MWPIYVLSIILISIIVYLTILWYVQQYHYLKALKHLPGPKYYPILGSTLEFGSIVDILPVLSKWREKFGDVYVFNTGLLATNVIITDYKFVEFLLSSNTILTKTKVYHFFHRWLGTGVLTSTGTKWKKFRKMITPAFHFKILEQFVEVFDKNGKILIKSLNKELFNQSFDIYPYITLYTLDVICESALGIEINAQEDSESEYVRSVKGMLNMMLERAINPLYMSDFFYKFTKMYKKELRMLQVLNGTTQSVIDKKKKFLQNANSHNVINNEENDFGIRKKLAFLDLLLQSTVDGRPLTDREIQEEVSTFMFAGHDTTASSISFIIYNLSLHPEVQEKVFDEIKEMLSNDPKRKCSYMDLQEMKYLEAVIKESLRLFCTVPMIGRMHEEDVTYNGVTYPAGIQFLIYMYDLLRSPKLFPNPEEFNPDRFLVQGKGHHLPFAFIPFSAGPRNCIGQKFAMLEMKTVLTKLLVNYEILPADPVHKVQLIQEGILKSANGIKIQIRERRFNKS